MLVAAFSNLLAPDLIVIALIVFILIGIPTAIAIPIVFILERRRKKPPPLPKSITPD
jgi:hypothetical protein